jgi:hypothetical protein
MVAGLNRSVAHSITALKLGDRCKNIFGSALTTPSLGGITKKKVYSVKDRDKSMKIASVWVGAGLGRTNAQPTVDDPCNRIIPLEHLTAATEVVYMNALGRIEIVLKFTLASRTVHSNISWRVSIGIPLLFP